MKELTNEEKIQILRQALIPFQPGTNPIPWGKIKAHLPTDLAKMLTFYNMEVSKALEETK